MEGLIGFFAAAVHEQNRPIQQFPCTLISVSVAPRGALKLERKTNLTAGIFTKTKRHTKHQPTATVNSTSDTPPAIHSMTGVDGTSIVARLLSVALFPVLPRSHVVTFFSRRSWTEESAGSAAVATRKRCSSASRAAQCPC